MAEKNKGMPYGPALRSVGTFYDQLLQKQATGKNISTPAIRAGVEGIVSGMYGPALKSSMTAQALEQEKKLAQQRIDIAKEAAERAARGQEMMGYGQLAGMAYQSGAIGKLGSMASKTLGVGAATNLVPMTAEAASWMAPTAGFAGSINAPAIGSMVGAQTAATGGAMGAITGAATSLQGGISTLASYLPTSLQTVGSVAMQGGLMFAGAYGGQWLGEQLIGGKYGGTIGGAIGGAAMGFMVGGPVGAAIGAVGGGFMDEIGDFASDVGHTIGDFASDVGDSLGSWFCTEVRIVAGLTSDEWNSITKFRKYAEINHSDFLAFYLRVGPEVIEKIYGSVKDPIKFFNDLKTELILPVIELTDSGHIEDAVWLYKKFIRKYVREYTPEHNSEMHEIDVAELREVA